MPQVGPAEILVILVVALLVFGPKRLPEVGRQVGRGLRELRKIQETVRIELNDVLHADETDTTAASLTDQTRGTPALPGADPSQPTGARPPSRFRAPGV